jgi:hypothetical protein
MNDRKNALLNVLRVAGRFQSQHGCSAADAISRSTNDRAMQHLATRTWAAVTRPVLGAHRFELAYERISKMSDEAWTKEAERWKSYVKRLIRIEKQRHQDSLEMLREWLSAAGCK